MRNYFQNGRRMHRLILCQNYMIFPLVLYPLPPYFEVVYCFFVVTVAEGWLLLDIR